MPLQWDETLLVGVEEIDNQHQSIFEHFGKLTEAVQMGKSDEVLEQLASFLIEHAQVHFIAEEKIMTKYSYPKIDEQRNEHKEFARDANELKKRLLQEGATREMAIKEIGTLLRWIINHIRHHDMEMITYIKKTIVC